MLCIVVGKSPDSVQSNHRIRYSGHVLFQIRPTNPSLLLLCDTMQMHAFAPTSFFVCLSIYSVASFTRVCWYGWYGTWFDRTNQFSSFLPITVLRKCSHLKKKSAGESSHWNAWSQLDNACLSFILVRQKEMGETMSSCLLLFFFSASCTITKAFPGRGRRCSIDRGLEIALYK